MAIRTNLFTGFTRRNMAVTPPKRWRNVSALPCKQPTTLCAEVTSTMPINAGDTAWVLVATGLVFLMLPGVAFLEAGFLRAKNVVSTMMQVFTAAFLVSIIYIIIGFTLSFGPDQGGILGGLSFLGLRDVDGNAWAGTTIPGLLYFAFQLMFAAVTVALVTGAIAERMRYLSFFIFVAVFVFIYAFPAHWVWGGGWLARLGVVDFAGSIVVHITAGVASIVAALMLGRRIGFGQPGLEGHNLSLGALGGFLLWFGWFGFNGGSALAANGVAATALVNTNMAAASGAFAAIMMTWSRFGKPSLVMGINGSLAGMAAVTGGAGYVSPISALVIGVVAGLLMVLGMRLVKGKLGVDDALDVSCIHGIPGIWGALAVGLFADGRLGNVTGLFAGGGLRQLAVQGVGSLVVLALVGGLSFAVLFALKRAGVLRPNTADELVGLDIADHREKAYA
ncbi:MAG: ammonium transporter [Chloroflexi bacterium]|nr:ammonium transporter [Chloroflexota bacterium]